MRIDNASNISRQINKRPNQQLENAEFDISKNLEEVSKELEATIDMDLDLDLDVLYEESSLDRKMYSYDLDLIEALKEGSENLYGKLKSMLGEILKKQGSATSLLKGSNIDRITPEEVALAREFVSEDGPRGIEAMSERIKEFVRVSSAGEEGKITAFTGAVDEAFEEVEEGQVLPVVSRKTYDRIMEKLDQLILRETLKNEPEKLPKQFQKISREIGQEQKRVASFLEESGFLKPSALEELGKGNFRLGFDSFNIERVLEIVGREEAEGLIELASRKLNADLASDRLVELIEISSEGDSREIYKLIGHLDKVFKGEEFKGFPMVAETYRRTIEKLKERYFTPALFYEVGALYSRIVGSNPFGAKLYLTIFGLAILFYFLRKLG